MTTEALYRATLFTDIGLTLFCLAICRMLFLMNKTIKRDIAARTPPEHLRFADQTCQCLHCGAKESTASPFLNESSRTLMAFIRVHENCPNPENHFDA